VSENFWKWSVDKYSHRNKTPFLALSPYIIPLLRFTYFLLDVFQERKCSTTRTISMLEIDFRPVYLFRSLPRRYLSAYVRWYFFELLFAVDTCPSRELDLHTEPLFWSRMLYNGRIRSCCKTLMVGAINTALRRGPDTIERISFLQVAVQAIVDAMFILHTTLTTVYFEENSRVIILECTYFTHVNKHVYYTTDTISI
jgi:energy-converting hydrogenase Eha subunit C